DQRRRGDGAFGAVQELGVDGDGPHEQAAGGRRGRYSHPGDGPTRRASTRAGVGARLRAAVCDRRVQSVSDGNPDPLWLLEATRASPGPSLRCIGTFGHGTPVLTVFPSQKGSKYIDT